MFTAIEEAIKKAEEKTKDKDKFASHSSDQSVLEEARKAASEELNKEIEDLKKEVNPSTAKDLNKIRKTIAKINDWKNSVVNLGQNEKAFEQNTVAKNYLEELQKKVKELEKSFETTDKSPRKEENEKLSSQKQDKEQSSSEQSNQLSQQEIETFKNQIQNFQNQLSQLQIQIQLLLISQNNENQIQQIQEQLNAFQSQIQSLENKPNISNNPDLQLSKQKLFTLGNQAQQLQRSLQVRQNVKEKEQSIKQPSSPQKEFNFICGYSDGISNNWIVVFPSSERKKVN